jgi:putative membrane-bound dehydrogenase-like protein
MSTPLRLLVRCLPLFAWSLLPAQDGPGRVVQVADGLAVELVAAPPLVRRPVSLAMDEQGALYVTDSSGRSPHGREVLKDIDNRVLRLVDVDGDGRYDTATVFADGLTFPEGCLWRDGSLYVGTTPTITRLTDGDGDGIAEQRAVWYDGKTLTGCANDLHGPYLGNDGTILWCKGAFDEQRHQVDGRPWSSRAAHIFRCRPDGNGFEPVLTGGMDNPVDTVQTSRGQRFLTTTFFQHPEAGRRDGLIHAVHGGVWGKDHDVLHGHRRTGALMPVMTHLGAAAPCGLEVLSAAVFGTDASDSLVACQFNLRKVSQHVPVAQGATFITRDRDLLWSRDLDFHPTDVIEDADGSLLVADTGGWYKICCPTSQLARPDMLGGIYRLRRAGAAPMADTRGLLLEWGTVDVVALAARVGDARPAVQRRAQAALAARGTEAVPALVEAFPQADPATRRRLLWTLARIDAEPARAAVRAVLGDDDASVQEVACHIVALWRDGAATDAVMRLTTHPDAGVRRVAVEALGRSAPATRAVVAGIRRALGDAPDRFLDHSVCFAQQELLLRAQPALVAEWFIDLPAQVSASETVMWSTALIALDQALPERLEAARVLPLLDHPQAQLRDTARWITAHHGEWGDALVGMFLERLTDADADADQQAGLRRLMRELADAPAVSRFLAEAVNDALLPAAARVMALSAMSEVSVRQVPPSWAAALGRALEDGDGAVVAAALRAAARLPITPARDAGLGRALRRCARSQQRSLEERVQAYAAIPGGIGAVDADDLALLLSQVRPTRPVAVRAGAVRALAGADLTLDQKRAVLPVLVDAGPLELGRLLTLFLPGMAGADEELGLRLIGTLRGSRAGAALPPEEVLAVAKAYPSVVQAAAAAWIATLRQDAAQQAAHLDGLLGSLPAGDAHRGQEVFNSPRGACTTCHLIGYVGGRTGPDLTAVGTVRTRRDLLEAVVFPSASFVRSYEPWIVRTTAGELLFGTIVNEGDDFIAFNLTGGLERRLSRDDIADLRRSQTSLMPAGLDRLLSAQELADLLAFLESRRG